MRQPLLMLPVLTTSVLLLLVVACAGAGIGMFTTEPVSVGQLLLVSQPLATVTLDSAAAASGGCRYTLCSCTGTS
jgi:hypothetical protein